MPDLPPTNPAESPDPDRTVGHSSARPDDIEPGAVIAGKYKLLEPIGEGGMGAVWLAQQFEPVKRHVAIKLIRAGMDSKTILARFEAERQALSMMDHPNIARVFDGGTTPAGRPFFVMELVKGTPITDFCDARKLTPRQRLELFVPVCLAIQHAHQKGIIHRDIKPSNVLVALHDDKPVPKVIDFGVAKATGFTLTESTLNTGFEQVVGTPVYMSPEQATFNQLDIDTRSDVYSLGVLLYELLTGTTPIERERFKKAALLEMLRVVREEEPPRPSARLSSTQTKASIAENRGTEPVRLSRELRTELDWVVMKSLEKDRSRRYDTASSFAADVQRYLSGEAVLAHPPSTSYRLRMFVRRNRGAVAVASAASVLILGIALAAREVRVQREEDRIIAEEVTARSQKQVRADTLVQALSAAQPHAVHQLIAEVAEIHDYARPKLLESAKRPISSKEGLHARLALLHEHPAFVEAVMSHMLDCEVDEVLFLRGALAKHKSKLPEHYWPVAQLTGEHARQRRLRACAALAMFDPGSDMWSKAGPLAAKDLVSENPFRLSLWSEALRPIKHHLYSGLSSAFRDPHPDRATERALAASVLNDYTTDDPALWVECLMDADAKQFPVFASNLGKMASAVTPMLLRETVKILPAELPSSSEKREKLAKRQVNAGVALALLKHTDKVWPLLQHSSDPRVRNYLLHRLGPSAMDVGSVLKQLAAEKDGGIRQALLLSIGEFDEQVLRSEDRRSVLPMIQAAYCDDPDAGIHSAAEWLLRSWGQDAWLNKVNRTWAENEVARNQMHSRIREGIRTRSAQTPQWCVNTQGQTFIVLPGPIEFMFGSPVTEPNRWHTETLHRKRIGRSIAIAAKSVTLMEYRRLTGDPYHLDQKYSRHPELPAIGLTWYRAAEYCNLLSRREGLEECYSIEKNGKFRLKESYLGLSGYRLPTEAEMEYAVRGGTRTCRHCGETEDLLDKYEWNARNSGDMPQRVGMKKPNRFGLFDSLGNCLTWCQEPSLDSPVTKSNDVEIPKEHFLIRDDEMRFLRGASYLSNPPNIRSANHFANIPKNSVATNGVRPVRTFDPLP